MIWGAVVVRSLERVGSLNLAHHCGQTRRISLPLRTWLIAAPCRCNLHAVVGAKPAPTLPLL